MKKKNVALMIAIAALGLTACAKSSTVSSIPESTVQTDAQEQTQEETLETEETLTTEETNETQIQPEAEEPGITITMKEDNEDYTTKDGIQLSFLRTSYPVVDIEDNDHVSKQIADYYRAEVTRRRNLASRNASEAETVYENEKDDENSQWYLYYYGVIEENQTARADGGVISFETLYQLGNGGEQYETTMEGVNFSTKNGQILTLADVMRDEQAFREFAASYIQTIIEQEYDTSVLVKDYKEQIPSVLKDRNWAFTGIGISIYCNNDLNPGEIMTFTIPYELLLDYLKEDYLPYHREAAVKMAFNQPQQFDVDGDGTMEIVELCAESEDEYSDYEISVRVDSVKEDIGSYGYYWDAYFIRKEDGSCGVMFEVDFASDDYTTYLYRLDSKKPVQTENIFASFEKGSVQPNGCNLEFRVDMLGTWGSSVPYTINDDWTLTTEETVYELGNGADCEERRSLTNQAELPVTMDGENQIRMLPVGTVIYPMSTDGQTYLDFETEDGKKGRIAVEKIDYSIKIDGIDEYSYFSEIPYAG